MDTPDLETESSASDDLDDFLRRVANAPPRDPPPLPASGARWGRRGRYRIEECLGKGGMGTVYLASDLILDRHVALKVLHRTSEIVTADDRGQLLREARAAACVEHERIARVYDVGEHDGAPFVAMEFIRGVTLRRWMQGRVAEAAEIAMIGVQIAEGLDALHRNGIVHRDVKPENVMLTESGGIKLLDLGLAKRRIAADPDAETLRSRYDAPSVRRLRAGTPGYMAPEQLGGLPADARADVFALGVILFELVARERPFEGVSLAELTRATLVEAPSFASERWRTLPPAFRVVVEKALAKDPDARLASARAILEALTPLLPATSVRVSSNALAATIDLEHAPTVEAPSGSTLLRRAGIAKPSGRRAALIATAIAVGTALLASDRVTSSPALPPSWAPAGMVGFAGGAFVMGRDKSALEAECPLLSSPCPRDLMAVEAPAARGRVAPFAIDQDEVVVGDFALFLDAISPRVKVDADEETGAPRFVRFASGVHAGELIADLWKGASGIAYRGVFQVSPGAAKLPVRLVTWLGANLYCRYRGARLPTEAEWEYAARGTTARRFPWGDDPPLCGAVNLPRDGSVPIVVTPACAPALDGPVAVGASPQDVTPEGVRDLGGNVVEWTDTKLSATTRAANEPPSTDRDERAGDVDDPMMVRGGSYHESFLARSTGRARLPRGSVGLDVGFRCARSAPAK